VASALAVKAVNVSFIVSLGDNFIPSGVTSISDPAFAQTFVSSDYPAIRRFAVSSSSTPLLVSSGICVFEHVASSAVVHCAGTFVAVRSHPNRA
jgi:hypothetical protein